MLLLRMYESTTLLGGDVYCKQMDRLSCDDDEAGEASPLCAGRRKTGRNMRLGSSGAYRSKLTRWLQSQRNRRCWGSGVEK